MDYNAVIFISPLFLARINSLNSARLAILYAVMLIIMSKRIMPSRASTRRNRAIRRYISDAMLLNCSLREYAYPFIMIKAL